MKKKYVVVGTGGRCVMFIDPIMDKYREESELVGLCDISLTRMEYHNLRMEEKFEGGEVPMYLAEDFGKMLEEQKPDVVIVTTMDSTHHEYIIKAMEFGCDVITEKPMTTDAEKANAIFDAIKRTGKKLRVAFNYRYSPGVTKVRELIRDGVIGNVHHVDLSWVLDTRHGADYFRRWHREKDKSGGLLVHKSTHHFDLVNWWIGSYAETVYALGGLKFYGKENADARGEKYSYDRYTGHKEEAKDDPFALFLDEDKEGMFNVGGKSTLQGLYLDAEKDSGYIRDRNVFGEGITAEDTLSLLVKYRNGVTLNYSLVAYSPWEGFQVAITGDKGRIEYFESHGSHIIAGQSDEELAAEQKKGKNKRLRVYPMFGTPYDVEIVEAPGGHGGGDPIIQEQMFSSNPPEDPFKRGATHIDGAASILVGIAGNKSIATGQVVTCNDLLPLP